ncbi:fungal-specific transcription factor domain-containing protein [Thelonectria olida]|uniref:Fungal-specific transcription factor domain-containing protein n=1 Tax=Thelonectria olida TaxID=1576542 RepID=A0A9P9APE7_9HYPO|nr:fungal-specific transcription factor domain-containing protein [Thelonectria olida]
MEDSNLQTWKRKACDVCYTKKIKCNLGHPSCSNCQLYGTQCKTSLVRRRAAPQRTTSSAVAGALEARVASLEEQLQRLNQQSRGSHDGNWQHATTSGSSVSIRSLDWEPGNHSGIDPPLTLPPLDDIIPTVERYFEQVNPFIPLFDETSFFRILMEWYPALPSGVARPSPNGNKTGSRRAIFAAINVVLALSYRMPHAPPQKTTLTSEDPRVEICMQNIEHAINHLISGEEELLSLQVLLGLILLRIGCKDPQPATILIGSAVQLCCRLFLNDREENAKHSAESRLQRERVFWVTYILDKDISLRYHTAPLLSEADIDVDLPSDQPTRQSHVDLGLSQEAVLFDYFNSRIQLAILQSQVYKQIYSNGATPQKLTPEERRARMFQLDDQLERWRRSIPEPLQMENLVASSYSDGMGSETTGSMAGIYTHMTELYCTYMSCLVRVHGIWSHDAEWLNCISSFQRQAVHDCAMPRSRCGTQLPPLPKQWDRCVKAGRDCLQLAHSRPFSGSNKWSTVCAYVSSLIIVLANLFHCNDRHQLEKDQALTRQGLVTFAKLREASNWQPLHQLHSVVLGLNERATQDVAMKMIPAHATTATGLIGGDDPVAAEGISTPMLQDFSLDEWNFSDNNFLDDVKGLIVYTLNITTLYNGAIKAESPNHLLEGYAHRLRIVLPCESGSGLRGIYGAHGAATGWPRKRHGLSPELDFVA